MQSTIVSGVLWHRICVRRAAKLNCHTLKLLIGTRGNFLITSTPTLARLTAFYVP